MREQNLVLIGMPAAGKSTVGRALAERSGLPFIDTDDVVAQAAGMSLPAYIQSSGLTAFRQLEERTIAELEVDGAIVATGGSAVYGERAMAHLASSGLIVFLDAPLDEVRRHIGDQGERAVVRRPGQSLEDLFNERRPLYQRWAQVTVACTAALIPQVVAELASLLDCPA